MRGINSVFILGHLGHNPELRTTPTGKVMCELRLATHRSRRNGDEWVDETDWHRITLWDQQAEVAHRFLHKGSPVAVDGRLRTDSWEDKQTGQRRFKTYVAGYKVHLIGSRQPSTTGDSPVTASVKVAEEEIPF